MISGFVPYVEQLERLAGASGSLGDTTDLSLHLDGEAGRRLRDVATIADLRKLGAFFTGESLARRLLALVPRDRQRYVDAACGCGDLLLAASTRLKVDPSLEVTLAHWNRQLLGRDLVPAFVRAARARLVLAALSRGAVSVSGLAQPADLLTNIAVGDGLALRMLPGDAVLLNPPYGRVPAPESCEWTSGKTTEAALFLDSILEACGPGAHVAAVLPEVLRAGSRYARFRSLVEGRLAVKTVQPAGVFDALTDVDVFLLTGDVRKSETAQAVPWVPRRSEACLSDVCEVSVGALVAYRDPALGVWHAYLDAHSRGGLREVVPEQRRRFRGTVVKPPFVVIGRTNRPNEGAGPRVQATIVRGRRSVAVENHLLVLRPHDATLRGCQALVSIVESDQASAFLDERLRCRHLTVGAVREIPR
ncbi:MAG TPA: hypothetical protein VK781_00460 [Solirubrobacteraceae bacterium]|jgi:hypothetical protein|nr:hypothetical protein [Solirubrobacteraceae bacterium]